MFRSEKTELNEANGLVSVLSVDSVWQASSDSEGKALTGTSTGHATTRTNPIGIGSKHVTESLALLTTGKHIMSEGQETKIQQGRVGDGTDNEQPQWEPGFRQRSIEELEREGDTGMASKNHLLALGSYSNVLSLEPPNISDIIIKCCKARVGLLEDELVNITRMIERDPWNYKGYKRKHTVLHSLGRYKEAFDAFQAMLSRVENSSDPRIRDLRHEYLDTTPLIRQIVEQTIYEIPHTLIDTTSGRLCDKTMQLTAFERCTAYYQLRSSMVTSDRLDRARIRQEVSRFYEYVMLSHKWQQGEPTFQMIKSPRIYDLARSPAIIKLVNFLRLVQSLKFRWAWCDTCCINQSDGGVLQEAMVAMFQWYSHAALTVVHLLGVSSDAQIPGSLCESIWNTRGWTFQEYIASRVIRFYTEDWKPYLGLEIFNHKESPVILREMELATEFSAQALATLQPGPTRVREKLFLSSKRQTTHIEDIAYCLFGIFRIGLPVTYGEGNRAVGRLLGHVLTLSGDVTILAWTGKPGDYNSCLPSDLTVYDQVNAPHIPHLLEPAEMDRTTSALQSSYPNPKPIIDLYEQLLDLPPLSTVAGRLRLSGFTFRLTGLRLYESNPVTRVYHTMTPILGEVQIETKDNLMAEHGLILVHPWIGPLLDEDFNGDLPLFDLAARAYQLIVRLRQPFGALLLAAQGRAQYRRVATGSFIKVQIQAETPLEELMNSIHTVDIQ